MKKCFSYIGKRGIYILFFHFIAFKPITAFEIVMLGEPWYKLASFPILYSDGAWWFLYMLSGVGIPIFIERIRNGFRTI